MERKVVLGLGDVTCGDIGLGIQALKALGGRLGPQSQIELVDSGRTDVDLPQLIAQCSHLLVLDALDIGRPPGTLVELSRRQVALYSGMQVYAHQLAFQAALEWAGTRGHLPEHLSMIGAQPSEHVRGPEMSEAALDALPEVIERAVRILERWNLLGQ
jgi:hydrogenase maturation protease